MRLGVMGCIMRVKNKIDPKTKEPLVSVKDFEDRTLEAKETLERVCKQIFKLTNAAIHKRIFSSNS